MSSIPSVEEIIDDLMKQNDGVNPNSPIPVEQQLEKKRAEYRQLLELASFKERTTLAIETIQRDMATTMPADEFENLLSEIADAAEVLATSPEKQGVELGLSKDTLEKIFAFAHKTLTDGKLSESTALFTLLTTLDGSWFRHWFYLGVSLQEQKEYEEAVKAYAQANLITEQDPLAHLNTAECYVDRGDMQQARLHLDKGKEIVQKEPANPAWKSIIDELEAKIK